MSNLGRVGTVFFGLRDDVASIWHDFGCDLRLGRASEFPELRDHAYCEHLDGKITIVIAPKMLNADDDVIEGVLRHELAHAVEFHTGLDELQSALPGLPEGVERRADEVAYQIWGDHIAYNDILVQTIGDGLMPRPIHLGA